MNEPRKLLFYALIIPLTLVSFAFILLEIIAWHAAAACRLIENIMFRFEHWAFKIPTDLFSNSPFKRTLHDVYFTDPVDRVWDIVEANREKTRKRT